MGLKSRNQNSNNFSRIAIHGNSQLAITGTVVRCCILWQEDNFDMGKTINKRLWMTWSIINEK